MINAAIGNVTTALREGQQALKDKEARKEEGKFQRQWGATTIASLINMCQVDDESALPPVYKAIAESDGKAQERQAVQNAVDEARRMYNRHLQITLHRN